MNNTSEAAEAVEPVGNQESYNQDSETSTASYTPSEEQPSQNNNSNNFNKAVTRQLDKYLSGITGLRGAKISEHISVIGEMKQEIENLKLKDLGEDERKLKQIQNNYNYLQTDLEKAKAEKQALMDELSKVKIEKSIYSWANKNNAIKPERVVKLLKDDFEIAYDDEKNQYVATDKERGLSLDEYLTAYKNDKNNLDLFSTIPNKNTASISDVMNGSNASNTMTLEDFNALKKSNPQKYSKILSQYNAGEIKLV